MRFPVHSILALSIVATSTVSRAEDPVSTGKALFELSLEELLNVRTVAAASGYEMRWRDAPANTVVITADEWAGTGARTVFDLLQTVAGVHVATSWNPVQEQGAVIRGLVSALNTEVIWLLDGQPINDLINNAQPWTWRFPLAGLKQIEIVKGPGSAVYGADAVSGVINLVTLRKGEGASSASVRLGSWDTRDVAWQSNGQSGEWFWQAAFEHQESGDDPDRLVQRDLQTRIDSQLGTKVSRAPGPVNKNYRVDNGLFSLNHGAWRGSLWHWQARGGTGIGAAQALDPQGYHDATMQRARLEYFATVGEHTELLVDASTQTGDRSNFFVLFPAGAKLPIGADGNITFDPARIRSIALFTDGAIGAPSSKTRRTQLAINTLTRFENHWTLRTAIGHEDQAFTPGERKNFGPGVLNGSETQVSGRLTEVSGTPWAYSVHSERQLDFALVQADVPMSEQWRLTAGLRHDQYSDIGGTTNPRLTLQWTPDNAWQCRLQSGSAYRAPSFSEQTFKNNPSLLGNPALDPEEIRSHEAGCRWFVNRSLTLEANAFKFRADGLIDYATKPPEPGLFAQNLRKKYGDGGELQIDWRPSGTLRVSAAYSVAKVKDDRHLPVQYQPHQVTTLSSHWLPADDWQLSMFAKHVADRVRRPGDLRAPVDDYTRVDLTLSRNALFASARAALSVQNVGNEDLRDPSDGTLPFDLPNPGRMWVGELTWTFR